MEGIVAMIFAFGGPPEWLISCLEILFAAAVMGIGGMIIVAWRNISEAWGVGIRTVPAVVVAVAALGFAGAIILKAVCGL